MTDQLNKSQFSYISKQINKGFLSNDYTLNSETNRIQTPLCLNTPKSSCLGQASLDKQKLRSSSRQNEQNLIKNIFDIPNKFQSSKSFVNPSQLYNVKEQQLDKTMFITAEQEIEQKIKIIQHPSSKSLSVQKYKELISNASHSTMHLPALRIGQQKISEFSHQSLDKTIKEGFTSFNQIKVQNQDYLINLHQKRKSISNIVDIQDLENERSLQKQRQLQKDKRRDYKYHNIEYIQLELEHNKAMQRTFISNNEQSLIKKNKETFLDLVQREQKISKMPSIRKYPMQRKKQIQNIQQQQNYIDQDQHEQEQKKYHHEGMKDQEQIYKIYIYTIPQNDWKPSVREGATIVADKNKAYLFGGLGQDIFNQVEVLDLEQNLKWQKLDHNSTKNNTPVVRFGHSMNYYKGSLIVFGGETHFNTSFKQKQCLCDIFALNIDQKKWAQINVAGDIPQGRRGHASCIVGRWLIIHGGSNFRDFTLSDVWAFDLGTSSWQEISTVCQDISKNKYIATGHSCCAVFYTTRLNKITLFKYIDPKIPKWMAQIPYEGVYFFGGRDEDGNMLNTIRILKVDQNPIGWIFPEIEGKPPSPRYGHSMNYNQLLNVIVICGGENDSCYLNDMHILNVEFLTWYKVDIKGQKSINRANHCAVSYDSKLLIFGGLNQEGYVSSQIQMIELDETLSQQMYDKDLQKQKFIHEQSNKQFRQTSEQKKQDKIKQEFSEKRKSIDTQALFRYYEIHNYNYEEIPFSTKLIQEEKDNLSVKSQVEKLNFNNFVSFMPLPNKSNSNKLSRLLSYKNINQVNKQPNKNSNNQSSQSLESGHSKSPSRQLLQKTVNTIISNMKHS
ncbi:hypothetical protein ABPG72_013469 [Tetrahymena utriculariae]